MSLSLCRFPQPWKVGEIIPISKKPLPKVDNDLRPVTLTAILAKCFERIVLPKIKLHVMPLIDKLQFAYLPSRSTEDAINYMIHEVTQHLEVAGTCVRCMYIDYSSAFNTMQPHLLIKTLDRYMVPARLQLLVLDFLTNRSQYVRTSTEISSTITINTGAPQGCVLSAFLFILYTNDMSMNNNECKIIKYADDTVILGLIRNDHVLPYNAAVSYVNDWCKDNFLDLNVDKTKEMIFDFRLNSPILVPVRIQDVDVQTVKTYKYLGVNIQSNLKWDVHVNAQTKKANKRLYHLRCLRKLQVDKTIMTLFYNTVISSILIYVITVWYESCGVQLRKNLLKIRKRTVRIIQADSNTNAVEDFSSIHRDKCIRLARKIAIDQLHPLNYCFTLLPHRIRYALPRCRTSRYRNTFVPTAIRLLNDIVQRT